jgi:TM2 domain-containing membrane protein YozV
LHHFYLGNRRRGIYYLAFCWTMVPLILAWVDTIRLALANEREFHEKFVRHPA